MNIYVFDMDGTLTPPRLPMTEDFAEFFTKWQQKHVSFVATGSDYGKVKEQMPTDVLSLFTGIYCSMGNLLIANGKVLYKNDFQEDPSLCEKLNFYRMHTTYIGELFPNYIEKRIGMINFSVLGRDCPYADRESYYKWDQISKERKRIKEELSKQFPQYDIVIGGSISMDIVPKGHGKEQIVQHLRKNYPTEKIIFFGDKTYEGGNDFSIACALMNFENTAVIQVEGPKEVQWYLQKGEI